MINLHRILIECTFVLLTIFVFLGLKCQNYVHNVKLELNSTQKIITVKDTLYLYFKITNNEQNKIAFVKRKFDNRSILNAYWYLKITYNDSLDMTSALNSIIDPAPPEENEYYIIKPGESIRFLFQIDFTELFPTPYYMKFPEKRNQLFGRYKLRLFYQDFFHNHFDAIDTLSSNLLELEYVK
ncbi:MAG: hypothetical protein HZB41_04775 [Ignavibacteriae bacterium]|nr:hypothetical protein [Ignavibacteriota bacterium]